jgi:hypothetical protein
VRIIGLHGVDGRPPQRRAVGAVLVFATALGLAACSATATRTSGETGARRPGESVALETAPLAASLTTASATWAVVPMGKLSQAANTFWQLVVLPAHVTRWALATPPGVADNTGLVDAQAGTAFVTGFEASQLLHFSPLALTSDAGTSWTQAVLSHALASVPDALAATSSGQVAALTNNVSGATVLNNGPTSWHRVVSAAALAASPAGRRCGLAALTAVAYDPNDQMMVGASCHRRGQVGVLTDTAGAWQLVGPPLPRAQNFATTSVIRLRAQSSGVSALVSARSESGTVLFETNLGADGHWSQPAPLPLAPNATVVSSGFGDDGAAAVLLSDGGTDSVDVFNPGSNAWKEIPGPPPHSATIAFEPDGDVDALVVDGAKLTAYRSVVTTVRWQAFQVLQVPIQYGSSS